MSYGLTVVRRAFQQALNPPAGMTRERDAPEVVLTLQGPPRFIVGIVTFHEGGLLSLAERVGDGGLWETADLFINPDHVVSACACLQRKEG